MGWAPASETLASFFGRVNVIVEQVPFDLAKAIRIVVGRYLDSKLRCQPLTFEPLIRDPLVQLGEVAPAERPCVEPQVGRWPPAVAAWTGEATGS